MNKFFFELSLSSSCDTRCLIRDPAKRASVEELLQHPYLQVGREVYLDCRGADNHAKSCWLFLTQAKARTTSPSSYSKGSSFLSASTISDEDKMATLLSKLQNAMTPNTR